MSVTSYIDDTCQPDANPPNRLPVALGQVNLTTREARGGRLILFSPHLLSSQHNRVEDMILYERQRHTKNNHIMLLQILQSSPVK